VVSPIAVKCLYPLVKNAAVLPPARVENVDPTVAVVSAVTTTKMGFLIYAHNMVVLMPDSARKAA